MECVAKYQDALKKLDEATKAAETLAGQVTRAAEVLRNWKHAMVANAPGIGFPPELLQAPTIDARRWPTAEQVGKVLSEYHRAQGDVISAWHNVPPESRYGLTPPEKTR